MNYIADIYSWKASPLAALLYILTNNISQTLLASCKLE